LPIVSMPEVVSNVIEVPGMNGVLDLSEVPLGFPTYRQRQGSWEFKIAHDQSNMDWVETYSTIAAYLHGRRRTCRLLDDKSYYYTGRFKLNELKSDRMCNTIVIEYDLAPYKEMLWTTCEDWEWDPFDFIYGEITQSDFKNIPISGSSVNMHEWTHNQVGSKPVVPTITVNSTNGEGMEFRLANTIKDASFRSFLLSDGANYNPQIEFVCPDPENKVIFSVIGSGTISIDFRPGRL
ncbi:MAG: hypothetical protein J5614_07610, partial [Paludibacteraceae bacterium]|nr:hypothetical protein [Paludibacteraceae bacterium]